MSLECFAPLLISSTLQLLSSQNLSSPSSLQLSSNFYAGLYKALAVSLNASNFYFYSPSITVFICPKFSHFLTTYPTNLCHQICQLDDLCSKIGDCLFFIWQLRVWILISLSLLIRRTGAEVPPRNPVHLALYHKENSKCFLNRSLIEKHYFNNLKHTCVTRLFVHRNEGTSVNRIYVESPIHGSS